MPPISRRQVLLLGLAGPGIWLQSGCRASLPPWQAQASSDAALALLKGSAAAHGLSAFESTRDINVSYDGHWRRLVRVLQPALVDAGYRGSSQERLLLQDGLMVQSYVGPQGHKQVRRTYAATGESNVQVWFNGEQAADRDRTDAAALVADAYALFLLGPLLLVTNNYPRRDIQTAPAGSGQVRQGNQRHVCDIVNVSLSPGFGNSSSDRAALYIDRETHLMRRARITLNGLQSTQGALVDIDVYDHQTLFGITWPTRFHERLLRPAPLDVHRWQLTGLDVNRGEEPQDFPGASSDEKAAAPAKPLNR